MDVHDAGARPLGSDVELREVDSAEGRPVVEERHQTPRDLCADCSLCLLGRATNVRREDDVREALQGSGEARSVSERLDREDVHAAPGDVPRLDGVGESVQVDAATTCKIQQIRALLHLCELRRRNHVLGHIGEGHVQCNEVRRGEHLIKGIHGGGIAKHELGLVVVGNDTHAHRLGQKGHLGAHVPVPHDANRLSAHLKAPDSSFPPFTPVHLHQTISHLAGKVDDVSDHKLGNASSVGVWSIENRDAISLSELEVGLVGADAEAANSHQVLCICEDFLCELRLASHTNDVAILDLFEQLLGGQALGLGHSESVGFEE
mmetsp:Transcript_70672/g.166626  ORF Transcript_70672/g.166626 Transcript_70672/m.166626 type:complete len:319 (+) Transcript_70672:888-1844(+)